MERAEETGGEEEVLLSNGMMAYRGASGARLSARYGRQYLSFFRVSGCSPVKVVLNRRAARRCIARRAKCLQPTDWDPVSPEQSLPEVILRAVAPVVACAAHCIVSVRRVMSRMGVRTALKKGYY